MVRISLSSHDYTSPIVRGRRMSDWLATISSSSNEQQGLAYCLIHISLCFRKLQDRLISLNKLRLLGELIFLFDEGRLGFLTVSLIAYMHHFYLDRYGYLTELSPNYLSFIKPVYFYLISHQNNMFCQFTPRLKLRSHPIPF